MRIDLLKHFVVHIIAGAGIVSVFGATKVSLGLLCLSTMFGIYKELHIDASLDPYDLVANITGLLVGSIIGALLHYLLFR